MRQEWQALIEHLYQDFISFFLSDWEDRIDYNRPATFLKLPKSVIDTKPDAPHENVVIGIRFKDGKLGLLLLTLEQLGYDNEHFGQQIFKDYIATMEEMEYQIPTAALVIFLANSLPKTYEQYEYEFGKSRIQMNYPSYVVREQYLDDLWEMVNPITFAIASCRLKLENQKHPKGRFESKKLVTQKLFERYLRQRINIEAVLPLLKFIINVLDLEDRWETNFKDEMSAFIANQPSIPEQDKKRIIQILR